MSTLPIARFAVILNFKLATPSQNVFNRLKTSLVKAIGLIISPFGHARSATLEWVRANLKGVLWIIYNMVIRVANTRNFSPVHKLRRHAWITFHQHNREGSNARSDILRCSKCWHRIRARRSCRLWHFSSIWGHTLAGVVFCISIICNYYWYSNHLEPPEQFGDAI